MSCYTPSDATLAKLNAYGICPMLLSERKATLLLDFLDSDPENRVISNLSVLVADPVQTQIAYDVLYVLLDLVDSKDLIDLIDNNDAIIRDFIANCRVASFTGEWLDQLEHTIESNREHNIQARNRIQTELRNHKDLSVLYASLEQLIAKKRLAAEAVVSEKTDALERIARARDKMKGRRYRFPGQRV